MGNGTDPGNTTQDQVFLLSIPEVNYYYSSKERWVSGSVNEYGCAVNDNEYAVRPALWIDLGF